MHKNASFFLKTGILPQRWGLRPQTHVDLRRLGLHPETSECLYSHHLLQLFFRRSL